MDKSMPVVSNTELNGGSTALPNTVSVSASKYVMTIYAFGLAHEKFGICNKAIPKLFQCRNSQWSQAKRTAEPFQIEIAILNCFRWRLFHELNQVRLMKRSASETGLRLCLHGTGSKWIHLKCRTRWYFVYTGLFWNMSGTIPEGSNSRPAVYQVQFWNFYWPVLDWSCLNIYVYIHKLQNPQCHKKQIQFGFEQFWSCLV